MQSRIVRSDVRKMRISRPDLIFSWFSSNSLLKLDLPPYESPVKQLEGSLVIIEEHCPGENDAFISTYRYRFEHHLSPLILHH